MEFWEALYELSDYNPDENKYICKICAHKTNQQWAIWRHLDNKHPDKLFEISGRAHGWNSVRNGWED